MAHTKAQGAVKGNRDSRAKRLGVKVYGGQRVKPGSIVVRQRGTKVKPGNGMSMGKDFTLYSLVEGIIKFKNLRGKKVVEVISK